MKQKLLEGTVGIITGGGSGIGAAAAELFTAEGAKVVIAGRTVEKLDRVVEKVRQQGGEISACRCDIRSEEEVKALVEFTVKKYGKLNWAFNNAGVAAGQYEIKLVHESSTEFSKDIININVMGCYYCLKYEIPELLKAGGGTIVNNASNIAQTYNAGSFAYSVSKNAVFGATKAAAIDYADKNIRINAIAPGLTDTPMIGAWKAVAPDEYAALEATIPDRRGGNALEMANTALYLLSEYSTHINGQMIVIDGGQNLLM